jgi:hypothetical protein
MESAGSPEMLAPIYKLKSHITAGRNSDTVERTLSLRSLMFDTDKSLRKTNSQNRVRPKVKVA